MDFTFEYLLGNLVGNLVKTSITSNPRIDVVHAIIGNADFDTETTGTDESEVCANLLCQRICAVLDDEKHAKKNVWFSLL